MNQLRSPSAALAHFRSIDWISKIYLETSQYEIPNFAKTYQQSSVSKGYDGFFGQTLHSASTIPHLLHLSRKGIKLPSISSQDHSITRNLPPDLVLLVCLGPTGLDGWPGLAHGGITCSLLDNVMGHTITAFRSLLPESQREVPMFTGKLEVKFMGPVKTGDRTIVVQCWLTSRTEKKWSLKADIRDESGNVLAEGDSLWIMAGKGKL